MGACAGKPAGVVWHDSPRDVHLDGSSKPNGNADEQQSRGTNTTGSAAHGTAVVAAGKTRQFMGSATMPHKRPKAAQPPKSSRSLKLPGKSSGGKGKDDSKAPQLPLKPLVSFPHLHIEQLYDAELLLGSGGGGETYLCYELASHQRVAIKFMRRPLPKSIVQLVMREIQIQADLGRAHANIIGVRGLAITQSHLAIIMEYAAGGNMTCHVAERWESALSRNGLHYTEEEARFYFLQYASAVEFCHQHRVAHRDLKLDNTLLDINHNPPRLKICDFGFAKMWEPESTNLYTAIGTPVYMSPQLITAKNRPGCCYNGAKADVWASGVLLFVMLLGTFPFDHSGNPDPNSPDAHNEVWLNQIKHRWRDNPRARDALLRGVLSPECVNLLDALFEFDENKRISMAAVKQHPWLRKPLLPEHQAIWDALQQEQRQLDTQLAANPPQNAERDKALMSMIALATTPGKPGEQPWTLPLNQSPGSPANRRSPTDDVAGDAVEHHGHVHGRCAAPEMRVMGGALSKELDERFKREATLKQHPMRRFSLV